MDLRILEKNENSMRFVVTGISTPLANTLRRIILAEVPCMAIDDVIMIENSSVLHDEILALRLGLIPLKTDLDGYNLPEECTCNSELGCNLCRVVLTLDVEAVDETRTVYSEDLVSEDPNIVPVSSKIPIVKLAPGQKVRLEAYAKLGRGMAHAKWQPVSACAYRYVPTVEIDKDVCDNCGDCVDVCPVGVLEKTEDGVKVVNEFECTLCEDCVDACKKNPAAIKVSGNREAFVFYIESTGALPVERIITEALEIYKSKFKEFANQIAVIRNGSEETD